MGLHKGSGRDVVRLGMRAPDYIEQLKPYVPGKPIDETKREFGLKKVVKLASNENPLGPSPKAIVAARKAAKDAHLYPDANAFHLKSALSRIHKVDAQQIVIGNGSNDVIDLIVRTFARPGMSPRDSMLTSKAAFIAYKICAQIHGLEVVETELKSDFTFDLDAMLAQLKQNESIKIVFIANPNNPTGAWVSKTQLREFLTEVARVRNGSVLVVLDCAYLEYTDSELFEDPSTLLKLFPNLVVLRTFSKVYGLAGLRVGYGMAHSDVANLLQLVRQPFNANSIGLAAAVTALKDKGFVQRSLKLNRSEMAKWEHWCEKYDVPFVKSQGNFILVDTFRGFGKTGDEVFQACLKKGVILRPVSNYGLTRHIRISVGRPEENRLAMKVLSEAFRKHSNA